MLPLHDGCQSGETREAARFESMTALMVHSGADDGLYVATPFLHCDFAVDIPGLGTPSGGQPSALTCRVPWCTAVITPGSGSLAKYASRFRICVQHLRLDAVDVGAGPQRFCQVRTWCLEEYPLRLQSLTFGSCPDATAA